MFVESKADCRVFTGHLNYYIPPLLDETFVKAIDYIDELNFEDAKDDYSLSLIISELISSIILQWELDMDI